MSFVDFKAKAIELVKQAVEADNAQSYEEALRLYKASLEHFSLHMKYEKNPSAKKTITAKARRRKLQRAGRAERSAGRADRPFLCASSSPSTWLALRSCRGAPRRVCAAWRAVRRAEARRSGGRTLDLHRQGLQPAPSSGAPGAPARTGSGKGADKGDGDKQEARSFPKTRSSPAGLASVLAS